MQTQQEWVLKQLQQGRKLTAKDAMDQYGIMQMATRIFELKQQGRDIESEMIAVHNRREQTCHVAQYYLVVWCLTGGR